MNDRRTDKQGVVEGPTERGSVRREVGMEI